MGLNILPSNYWQELRTYNKGQSNGPQNLSCGREVRKEGRWPGCRARGASGLRNCLSGDMEWTWAGARSAEGFGGQGD